MLRGALQAAAVLVLVAPVALLALWRSPARRSELRWLLLASLWFVAEEMASHSGLPPRWGGWNWGGKLAEIGVTLAFVALLRPEAGLGAPKAGSWRPAWIATAIGLLMPVAGYLAGWRESTSLATFFFQATMPGLSEELGFRGFMQGGLDRVFGRPWRVLGAQCGWGLVLAQLAWALVHAVGVDRDFHVSFNLLFAAPPLLAGWLVGWIRARTESVWPCILAHNAGNLLLVVLSEIA